MLAWVYSCTYWIWREYSTLTIDYTEKCCGFYCWVFDFIFLYHFDCSPVRLRMRHETHTHTHTYNSPNWNFFFNIFLYSFSMNFRVCTQYNDKIKRINHNSFVTFIGKSNCWRKTMLRCSLDHIQSFTGSLFIQIIDSKVSKLIRAVLSVILVVSFFPCHRILFFIFVSFRFDFK